MNFYSPIWLYAGIAIVLASVAVLVAAARRRRKSLEIFASAKLAPELSKSYSPVKAGLKNAFFVVAIAAVCAALARPQYGYRWEESKSKGVDIIFAIDTSKSMLAEDITPNRLERAKLAVLDIVDMLKGDRIGIVAFSGQAFLQCPLTLDYDAFRMSLDVLDTNVIQRGGTNIAAAIDEAQTAFENTSARKILILISDGEELEASAAARAKLAKDGGLTIYTLGVGGEKGQAITITDEYGRTVKVKDENGKIVTSRLNEKVLAEVASAAGGFYGKLSPESAEKLFNSAIEPAQRSELSSRIKRLAIERFQIPLAVAIVLLALESLIGTRRLFGAGKRAFFLAALLAAVLPQQARAQVATQQEQAPSPVQQATAQQPSARQPEPARKTAGKVDAQQPTAKDLFNAGIDAFDKGDSAESQKLFEAAMKLAPDDFPMHAKALYNIGNAEYRTAITPLLEASSAAEVGAKLKQAQAAVGQTLAAADGVLKEGKPLLEKETQMIEAAKTDAEKQQAQKQSPLKNRQFQQKLSQAISQCESLEKLPSQVREESAKSGAAWRKSAGIASNAEKFYADALSLSPDFSDAKANLETAKTSVKKLSEQTAFFAQIEKGADSFEKRLKDIDIKKIVEELKKLVRDDNQQNQNNQNQQQNQNQQNQQNNQNNNDQNKSDNNQNSGSQQNENNKNSPENKSEQDKQDKQNDRKDNGKQDKQNPDNKNQNKPDGNRDNSGSQNKKADQNKQPENDKKDSPRNNGSASSPENKKGGNKDEQAVDNKKAENKPDTERRQPAPTEREQAKKPEEKRQSAGGAEKSDAAQNAENFRKAEGVMTKFEAKQLLESMKDGEKILPLRGFGEQKQRFEKSYKDW